MCYYGCRHESNTARLRLEHLAVDFEEVTSNGDGKFVASLFELCGAFNSLHIYHVCDEKDFPVNVLVHKICASGEHLKLLSLGMLDFRNPESDIPIAEEDLDRICQTCPNLQQVSYEIPEHIFQRPEGCENYNIFMNALAKLGHIRLLHLRVPHTQYLGQQRGYHGIFSFILSSELQKFANKFFGDLKRAGRCPLPNALVIGHVGDPNPESNEGACPRFCFLRAEQRDGLNRTVAVGVPVSRAMLRATQPYTNVLDYDTGTKPWEQWADQAMA